MADEAEGQVENAETTETESTETTEGTQESSQAVLPLAGVTTEDLKVEESPESEAGGLDQGALIRAQLEQQYGELASQVKALAEKVESKPEAKGTEDEEYADPDDNRFKAVDAKLDKLMSEIDRRNQIDQQRQAAVKVNAALADAKEVIGKLNKQDSFLSKVPQFGEIIEENLIGAISAMVQARPLDHGITAGDVVEWHKQQTNKFKKALSVMPSTKAAEGISQAEASVENKGNLGGGTSPSTTDKPPLDIDSDEFWEQKARETAAAFKRMQRT